jgi:hypothetical protein
MRYRGEVQVPTDHINWQLSSNGVVGALDFANRTVITRIQKQPPGYKFHEWPEGGILAHIKANQPKILGGRRISTQGFRYVLHTESKRLLTNPQIL